MPSPENSAPSGDEGERNRYWSSLRISSATFLSIITCSSGRQLENGPAGSELEDTRGAAAPCGSAIQLTVLGPQQLSHRGVSVRSTGERVQHGLLVPSVQSEDDSTADIARRVEVAPTAGSAIKVSCWITD